MLAIKKKFGKNAILKGMDLQEGATATDAQRHRSEGTRHKGEPSHGKL